MKLTICNKIKCVGCLIFECTMEKKKPTLLNLFNIVQYCLVSVNIITAFVTQTTNLVSQENIGVLPRLREQNSALFYNEYFFFILSHV